MPEQESGRVLVVDDEVGMREVLTLLFKRAGYLVDADSTGKRALKRIIQAEPYDVVITDLVMPGADGLAVLQAVKQRCSETQVIVITAHATRETAVEAMQSGAYDYVLKPVKTDEMKILVERAIEKRRLLRENLDLRRDLAGRFEVGNLVGSSRAMRKIVDLCRRIGDLRTNVLITGESGTGKELVAQALHRVGSRSAGPFVSVNCGALPENLMESELFGHEKGAFTGAIRKSEGLFREAEGGTLFLDEVGELPQQVQVKLLRALQERAVRPVGGAGEVAVDTRIIAASNSDLDAEVEAGRFRADLFYRLNVVRIDIPPLRERREDIPVLVEHFLHRYAREAGRGVVNLSTEAMQRLLDYRFSGNVRELENIIERAVALATSDLIGVEALPSSVTGLPSCTPLPDFEVPAEGMALDVVLESVERGYIKQALEMAGGVQTRAAELLGISFRSFRYRVHKLGLDGGGLPE